MFARATPGLALLIVLMVLAGCGADTGDRDPAQANFEVVEEHLGEPYESGELGVAFRPPLGWEALDSGQRERIAQALLARQEADEYGLQIVDLFLHAGTLSFAALSGVTRSGDAATDVDAYAEALLAQVATGALGETDAPGETDDDVTRSAFSVGSIHVTQIRYLMQDRVTFTLVFVDNAGAVAQLDYSIPGAAYAEEGIKIESSVATLRRFEQEDAQ